MIWFCFTRILSPLSPPFPFLCPFRSFPCILACPPCHPNVPMLPYVASYIFLCSLLSHLCASPVFPPPYSTKILPLQSLLGKWKWLVKSAFVYHEFSLSIRTSFLCPYFSMSCLCPPPFSPPMCSYVHSVPLYIPMWPLCYPMLPMSTLWPPMFPCFPLMFTPLLPHVLLCTPISLLCPLYVPLISLCPLLYLNVPFVPISFH